MTRALVNALWAVTGETREPAELDAVYAREGCWTLDGRAYEESGGTITLRLARATEAEVWQAADLLLREIARDEHRRVGELAHAAATRRRALTVALAGAPRGLALLTPPLCCDPDVHALYARAIDHAETALRYAPSLATSIHSALDADALTGAVLHALDAHEKDLRYTAACTQDHVTKVTHELDAEAIELKQRSWRRAMEVLRLYVVTPAVREVPATAGPRGVDACGREVTP